MDAQKKIETIRGFLDKLGSIDIDGAGAYLAEDAVLDFPFLESMKLIKGKTAIVDRIKSTTGQSMERMNFSYEEWYPTTDPNILIAEYRVKGTQLKSRKIYENRYISVFRFKDDKIALYRTYLNPLKLDPEYQ